MGNGCLAELDLGFKKFLDGILTDLVQLCDLLLDFCFDFFDVLIHSGCDLEGFELSHVSFGGQGDEGVTSMFDIMLIKFEAETVLCALELPDALVQEVQESLVKSGLIS